ncbi:hypothetical protein KR018_011873 [Drosophila ironensis]|nr:hypothetical protein KR018_011873 [Drosophila ironensis]
MLTQKSLRCSSHLMQRISRMLITAAPSRSIHEERGWENPYPMAQKRKDLKVIPKPDKSKDAKACWQTTRRSEYKCRSDIEFNVPAFLDSRKLCLKECAMEVEASDLIHYKPHDMYDKVYQRTWYECVIKKPRRKAHCIHRPPPTPRRKRRVPKTSSCEVRGVCEGAQSLGLRTCLKKKNLDCPRWCLPHCKPAKNPPKCRRPFGGGRCMRRKCKYPSFSECRHDPIPEGRPIECKCLDRPAICEMWRFWRRKFT